MPDSETGDHVICPICRVATTRLLCQVPAGQGDVADAVEAGGNSRTQLTIRTVTPLTHRCSDAEDCGRAVMSIAGELDAYGSSLVERRCHAWVSTAGDAVIDLSEVTLIGAAGTTLVEQLLRVGLGAVRLRDPSRIVCRVFDVLDVPVDLVHLSGEDPGRRSNSRL